MHDMLMERADIKDSKKAVIFEKIAEIDNNLMEGADEYLQLLDLAVTLMRQMKWKLILNNRTIWHFFLFDSISSISKQFFSNK